MQLRAQLFLFCQWTRSAGRSAKTYEKCLILSIFSRLGPFPHVFEKVKGCIVLKMNEIVRIWHLIVYPTVFMLLSDRRQQGGEVKLLKNDHFK